MFVRQGVTKPTHASPKNVPNVRTEEKSGAAQELQSREELLRVYKQMKHNGGAPFSPPVPLEVQAQLTHT